MTRTSRSPPGSGTPSSAAVPPTSGSAASTSSAHQVHTTPPNQRDIKKQRWRVLFPSLRHRNCVFKRLPSTRFPLSRYFTKKLKAYSLSSLAKFTCPLAPCLFQNMLPSGQTMRQSGSVCHCRLSLVCCVFALSRFRCQRKTARVPPTTVI